MAEIESSKDRLTNLGDELVKPTIRLVIALVVLFAIRFLLLRIPGADLIVMDPTITVAQLISGAVTLFMMAAVLNFASDLGSILRRELAGPPELERFIQLGAVLLILVWGYPSFRWLPYFNTTPGQYDLLFLVLGLIFGGWLGLLLYTNVDDFSAVLADEITSARRSGSSDLDPEQEEPQSTDGTVNPDE